MRLLRSNSTLISVRFDTARPGGAITMLVTLRVCTRIALTKVFRPGVDAVQLHGAASSLGGSLTFVWARPGPLGPADGVGVGVTLRRFWLPGGCAGAEWVAATSWSGD